ncbi:DUF3310 domain-containing protein [Campylobacter jejuni]
MTTNDPINPPHYKGFANGAQVIDITEGLSFAGGNVVKYVARACRIDGVIKGDPVEDLKKARWYIDRELARLTTTDTAQPVVKDIDRARGMEIFNQLTTNIEKAKHAQNEPLR